jgi:signal transduction histidine kinase
MQSESRPAIAAAHGAGPWLTGLTWKGLGLIAFLCVVNAVRRLSRGMDQGFAISLDGIANLAVLTVWGLMVALPVAFATVAGYNRLPRRPLLRYPLLALVVAVSSLAAVAVQTFVEVGVHCDGSFQTCFEDEPLPLILRSWVRYGSLCALFAVVFIYLRVADESTRHAQEAERDRARFVQRSEEARLRMLQAQIEPHFLFNTLANVRRLYQTDATAAEAMLENLMRYLAVALPQMRATDVTLGREAALTESYLAIQRIRMGHRLAFEIEIPERLREARLPPMMVLTLAENAIKHGISPLPEGGHVRITAAVEGDELQVRVADSGRGFTQSSGGGTGLANIRARLSGMYGSTARLTLALNRPKGVIATIAVPFSATTSSPGAP